MSGTADFFHAMSPILTANILTILLLYCFVNISKAEARRSRDYGHHIWLISMVLMFTLYGFYTWRNANPCCGGVASEDGASGSPRIRLLTPDPG